jgi:DNA-binding FrmR family transcriptional regulator
MEYEAPVKNRLRRVEGQLRGVLNMMEQNQDCRDVVTQLTAIRSALDRAIGLVVAANLEMCIREELQNGNTAENAIKDAVELLVKSR